MIHYPKKGQLYDWHPKQRVAVLFICEKVGNSKQERFRLDRYLVDLGNNQTTRLTHGNSTSFFSISAHIFNDL